MRARTRTALRAAVALALAAAVHPQLPAKGPARGADARDKPPAAHAAELAGEALPAFPDFLARRTFQEGEPIRAAVDPSRFPQVVGKLGAFHVVLAKTKAEWDADRTLADLTGAVETLLLGATLSANVVTVDSGTLAAGAPPALGRGFDLVVDLDGDGELSDGDLIDGYGDEPGLFVVRDPSLPGPLAVLEVIYSLGAFAGQDLFYPSAIAGLGELPVVFVAHANGASYLAYDELCVHLASHGFVVVSHQTNTIPGIATAAASIVMNTDLFLASHAVVAGGALAGHVDLDRLAWIGHGRSGEAVVVARQQLASGGLAATAFTADDVRLLVALSPTDLAGPAYGAGVTPFALASGGADIHAGDCPSSFEESFRLLDRADGARASLYLQGAQDSSFAGAGGAPGLGPCAATDAEARAVLAGWLLPVVDRHLRGSLAATDFLWRPWDAFHPLGAPSGPCVAVVLSSRPDPAGSLVLDDFEAQPSLSVSSSGGAVAGDVAELAEARLDDPDADFAFVAGQAMNGATYGGPADATRGACFSFASDRFLAFELAGGSVDARGFDHVSLRVGQEPRHPLTAAALGDLAFTLELEDAFGGRASVDLGVLGAGAPEPYQRTGCGAGAGWITELATARVRVDAFRGVDPSALARVTLRFGPSFGAAQGRLVVDELELVRDE